MLKVNHLAGFGKKRPSAGSSYDSDAQAFFTATGISDNTIKDAIDDLVVALKGYSIWTKFSAIYPFVGGSSSTHAVNLKSPGTYNVTWSGTVTHNSNGITGDGTTGYGNTGIMQSVNSANNEHISLYSRTNSDNGSISIGVGNSVNNGTRVFLRLSNNLSVRCQNSTSSTVSNASSLGYFSVNRTSSLDYRVRVNASNNTISATSSVAPLNLNYPLMAFNANGTINSFSSRNYAWFAIGQGLTETEDGNCRTAVEAFQDALSRGVVA